MKIDLLQYLEACPLDESRILQFDHESSAQQAVIVYEYAAEAISRSFEGLQGECVADFRRFLLRGVVDMRVRSFQNDPSEVAFSRLRERIATRPILIIGTEVRKMNGRFALHLEISNSFDVIVECTDADVQVKRVKASPDGDG